MTGERKDFAIFGGDGRFLHLCRYLRAKGYAVTAYGVPGEITAFSPELAAKDAENIILPLPAFSADNTVAGLGIDRMADICAGKTVFAGRPGSDFCALCNERHTVVTDYSEREDFAVFNAVPTAEGAIEILMRETGGTVFGAKVLILGFGRIGKVLADRMRSLGACVTVTARSAKDLAYAEVFGFPALLTKRSNDALFSADIVVNTIPTRILTIEDLITIPKNCILLDLASAPHGFDPSAAEMLGLHAIIAPGLPGKIAPVSAAEIIGRSILASISERGVIHG